ncbi:MAG: NAD(P)/FAD-dependent oxidoreductase [Candidatus Nanopelagicus sp.]
MRVSQFDLAIIGAGVVGSAIAREFAKHDISIALIDQASDVGDGTSKANTAILHTGFDMTPGSLESKLVATGYHLLKKYAQEVDIAMEALGGLLVAWSDEEVANLPKLKEKAIANGYTECELISSEQVYKLEPNLGKGALAALTVPGEWIIDPWTPIVAFATQAKLAGAHILLNTKVEKITYSDNQFKLATITPDGSHQITSKYLINAAGLYSDEIDGQLGVADFKITPRRGELIVFDKLARKLINHVILPVPSSMGKGVLVSPTVFGNIMLGPTAENLEDKTATGSTKSGLDTLKAKGEKIAPALLDEEITAIYAGLRAASEHADYQIKLHKVNNQPNYLTVGGIRSTGLTASMAIAIYVKQLLLASGITLGNERELPKVVMNNLGEASLRSYQDETKIKQSALHGQIICHCEKSTTQEVLDALASPIAPSDLASLARRSRAGLGRCQGFYCHSELRKLLEKR